MSSERTKVLRFLIVGGTNTAIMYGIYLALLWLGVPYLAAVIADYALGIVYGYSLNRWWTFRAHGRPRYGFVKYCTSYALVFGLNVALLVPFVEWFGWRADLAQIPAIAIATVASYGAQRLWVFRPAG